GETVTLNVTPADGYALKSISVTAQDETEITLSGEGNTRTFTMPNKNVTVNAEFERIAMDGYSLTLDDGINVNFYIDTPYYEAEGGTIQYSYLTTTEDKSAERTVYSADVTDLEQQDDGTRKLSLSAAPAQIAEDYIIEVYDANNTKKATLNASIEDYCQAITAIDDEKLMPYKDIAQSLLDYGALADEYFGYAALSKEVTGNDYAVAHSDDYKAAVNTSATSHLRTNAHASINQGGVKIKNVSYVALLEPEFRFYITKADDTEFTEAEAAALTVGTDVDGLTAQTVKTDSGICVRVIGLKASEFAKVFTLTIGDTTLTYNGYAYLYTVLTNSGVTDTKLKDLAKGVYRYAATAEATFA
ncbi:MAG: hypothetical protein IKF64_00830, partial [Eubacterium sp.]|nr:hypothetical protein [Eubacterium sp.]